MTQASSTRPTVLVAGKIINVETRAPAKAGGKQWWTYEVRTPARDEFSSPDGFFIRSSRQLGDKGALVSVQCEVSGRFRRVDWVDKETGEEKTRKFGEITLWAAE